MGLLSWLFPSPADKVAKARRLMEDGRHAEARLVVVDVDTDEARAVLAEAEVALVELNLERAIQRCRAGDEAQVESHLELARQFDRGAAAEAIARTEAELEALRAVRYQDDLWDELRAAADRRRRLGDDPGDFARAALHGEGAVRLFFGGDTPFGLPGVELEPRAGDFVPGWVPAVGEPGSLTASERGAIAKALREAWPAALHPAVEAAGEALVEAMAFAAARRPEEVVARLIDLPTDNPAARFELGRAAAALGMHAPAALALQQARGAVESAFAVGGLSLRVFGARVLRWAGAIGPAWGTMADLSAADRATAPYLYVALAMEAGRLAEAEAGLDALAADDPARPQLAAALELRRALRAEVEAAPILADRERAQTPAFRVAAEGAARRLQAEVDRVLAALRAAEEEGEGEAGEGDQS